MTRTQAQAIALVALAAGIAAAFAGEHPTAWAPADVVLTAGFVGAVVWAAATAPWWLLAISAFVAVPCSTGLWVAAAVAAFLLAATIGSRQASWPVLRAVSAGLTMITLLHSHVGGFHGSTALITGAVALALAALGLARRGRYARWMARRVAVVVAVVGGLAVIGAAVSALLAYRALQKSTGDLRDAATALRQGDTDLAGKMIERSGGGLRTAQRALDRPWVRPSLAVPVLGQHVRAAIDLVRSSRRLADTASVSITQINPDSLAVRQGVIDLNAIELLGKPLEDTQVALQGLVSSFHHARDPWLTPPVGDRLAKFEGIADDLLRQADTGLEAVRIAPAMLGRDGPRTYFVAFTNPAEARGIGGFMGTWAELHVDHGKMEVTRTGQTLDLVRANDGAAVLDMPEDFRTRYGGFGAGNGSPADPQYWSNVTMPADFPSVAQTIAQLYPHSGGTEIDGVIAMDTDAIARFLSLTGPIRVPGVDQPITAGNVADYILRGQYAQFSIDEQRDAALAALTDSMIRAVFSGVLPGPRVLADAVGPVLRDRRLLIWSLHPEDQAGLQALGVDGGLPAPPVDGLAVVGNNGGGNKLDVYLTRNVVYQATVDEERGQVTASLDVRLTNSVPANVSPYAAGNDFGLPFGTNRMYLSIYSPWRLTGAALDGASTGLQAQTEGGWWVYSTYLDLAAGQERLVHLDLAGSYDPAQPYSLLVRPQPLALPDTVRVAVRSASGRVLAQRLGALRALARLPESG